jgi:hypothetical protein
MGNNGLVEVLLKAGADRKVSVEANGNQIMRPRKCKKMKRP